MTRCFRYLLLLGLLSSIPAALPAQDVTVKSAFDSSRIYIGDQIRYRITVEKPVNLPLSLPFFKDTLVKSIEILSGPVIDSTSQNGRIKIVQNYLITSFDSGRYEVPPVFAEAKTETGIKRFYSDYAHLDVNRIRITPPDTTLKIFDIVKPYRAPVTAGEIIPWVLVVLIAAVMVWFGLKYLKKLRVKKGEEEIITIPDPAHIIAFRELENLRSQKIWESGEVKLYYTRLTEILRQYLGNRFHVYSLELTTAETLDALVKTGFRKDAAYQQLKGILTNADLVKFAKYQPGPEEHQSIFTEAWTFIDTTKEVPAVTETIAAGRKEEEKL